MKFPKQSSHRSATPENLLWVQVTHTPKIQVVPKILFYKPSARCSISFCRLSNFHEMAPRFIQRNQTLLSAGLGKAEWKSRAGLLHVLLLRHRDLLGMAFPSCLENTALGACPRVHKSSKQHIHSASAKGDPAGTQLPPAAAAGDKRLIPNHPKQLVGK